MVPATRILQVNALWPPLSFKPELVQGDFCKKFYIHASLRLAQRWRPQWAADMLSQPLSSAACTPVSAIETCEKKLGAHPSVQDVSKDIIGNQQAKPSA
mmetsp:Transcript_82383/g.207291  ORF Transcript_82383/g.207291 Transcript_82383/m.207291 type:complete len:99 (-) Transcript_82383:1149-1445(-)